MRLLLLNPNTNAATTAMMLAIARETAAGAASIDGITASAGAPVITDEPALTIAAAEIDRLITTLADHASSASTIDGIVIAAFGDPGLAVARARVPIPVIGIAEAAIAEACRDGRRFGIVTTTPALDRVLRRKVADYGATSTFAGIRYTRSGPDGMADPARLHADLLDACTQAATCDGATAIIIGGGPLAAAARQLQNSVDATLVEPIPAAIRALLAKENQCPTP